MKSRDLSFLVLGAGAVGGITAAMLKKNGYDVEIICKYDDYASIISEKGLNVSGVSGNFTVRLPAYASVKDLKVKKDIILHATKATDMKSAAIEALSALKEGGYFVSMQNGICEDELASVVGDNRVIGCVTGWGATMNAQGNLEMTSRGDFIIGYPDMEQDHLLTLVSEALSFVVPVKISNNIMGHLYSKLIINSCITSLGAICGLYLGEMLAIYKVRRIFIEIIREAVALADKMGIMLEVFGGRIDFKKFTEGNNLISDLKRHLMIRIIGFKYRRLKSSSLQSLERGKPIEIDYLNGYIVSKAEKFKLSVPVNTAIVTLIHEIESGTRKISVSNFDDPVFDRFNN